MRNTLVCLCLLVVVLPARAVAQKPAARTLTLKQALERARRRNENFLIAKEKLVQAKLVRDRAWAAFLPTVAANGNMTRADREIKFSDRVLQRLHTFSGDVSVSLTVFKGTAIPGIVRAYQEARAARENTKWTLNTLAFEVAQAYFAALSAENLLKASVRTLKSAQEHLTASRARRQVGQDTKMDEVRAQVRVVSAKGDLIKAKNVLDSSVDFLAYLVGTRPPLILTRPKLLSLPVGVAKAIGTDVLRSRPDFRAADILVKAARNAVREAWMDYLPKLTVTGTYKFTQNTGWSGEYDSWNIVISLEWVLFDGGLRRATILEKNSQLRETRHKRRLARRTIGREVRQAQRDMSTALASHKIARQKLKLARKNRDMVIRRYRAGLGTYLDLVDTEDELKKAEVEFVAEELNLALKKLELLRVLGYDPRGRKLRKR